MRLFKVAMIIVLVVLAANSAFAAKRISGTVQSFDATDPGGEYTWYLDKNRVRFEFKSSDGYQILIYNETDDGPVLWLVDDSKSQYSEVTKDDVKKVKDMVSQQMDMFEQQMARMEKDQRDMMKAQFGKQIERGREIVNPKDPKDYNVVADGDGATVGDWKGKNFAINYKDDHVADYVVASWGDVGMSRDDMGPFFRMRETYGVLAGNMLFAVLLMENKLDGFPVKTTSFEDGEKKNIVTVKSIDDAKSLDDQLFTLAKGLTKQDMFGGN